MRLFNKILNILDSIRLDEPFEYESELEERVARLLRSENIKSKTQQKSKDLRYDVICNEGSTVVCIELKVIADTSNVKQFDEYHQNFPNGFIILCWRATGPLRDIFESVKRQSPTSIALVEISQRSSMI